MNDIGLVIKATKDIYVECAKSSLMALVANWQISLGSLVLLLLFYFSAALFSGAGMAGGFIIGILSSLFTSLYYWWLEAAVRKEKLALSQMVHVDWGLFGGVISVSFILYIVYFLASPTAEGPLANPILLGVCLILVFVCNALPESTYLHRYESFGAFFEAARFTKENWIEWYLPFVLLLLPWIMYSGNPSFVLMQFALLSPLLPGFIIMLAFWMVFPASGYLGLLVGLVLANWYMLFRGFLFLELESGSRRRRIYLAKQK